MNMANTTKVNTIYVPLDNITSHINSKSCLYKSITADIDVNIYKNICSYISIQCKTHKSTSIINMQNRLPPTSTNTKVWIKEIFKYIGIYESSKLIGREEERMGYI